MFMIYLLWVTIVFGGLFMGAGSIWTMTERGFDLKPGNHPIIPVMLGDAKLASEMADKLLAKGVYVIGFSFPVVPRGEARIRTQMSAGVTREQLDKAIDAFTDVGRELGVI